MFFGRACSGLFFGLGFIAQNGFVILTSVVQADNGNETGLHVHLKGDNRTFFVIGDAQTGAHIVPYHAANGKGVQVFAVCYNRFSVPSRYIRRSGIRDILVQREKLFLGFRRKDDT